MMRSHFFAGLALVALVGLPNIQGGSAAPSHPRIRIVPQTSDGILLTIEESKDGSRLLTHDDGYAPRLWDAKRQILLQVLGGHKDMVLEVNFSPDGKEILTLSQSQLSVWDAKKAHLVASFPCPAGDAFTHAKFNQDGSNVALGTANGAVSIFDVAHASARSLGTHSKAILCLAFRPDGKRLYSGGADSVGQDWDVQTGALVWKETDHKKPIEWAYYSADGKHVLSTALEDKADLVSDETGKVEAKYDQVSASRSVRTVQMGALFCGDNDSLVVTCAAGGDMPVFPVGASKPAFVLKGHTASVREIRRHSSGRFLATYGDDQQLKMWDVKDHKELGFTVGDGSPTAGEFSPNSDSFWLGYEGGQVDKYDVLTGKAVRTTYGAVERLKTAGFVGDNAAFLATSHGAGGFFGGAPTKHLFLDPEGNAAPFLWRWDDDRSSRSPNGRYFMIQSRGEKLETRMVDVWSKLILFNFEGESDWAFSPDSSKLALTLPDGHVGIYDCKTQDRLQGWQFQVDKKQGDIRRPAFSPDGDLLATSGHPNNSILIWNWHTGKVLTSIPEQVDLIKKMAFTPDGKSLVVMGWAKTRIVDVASGAKIEIKGKDNKAFDDIAFSKDGSLLALGNEIETVVVSAATGKVTYRHDQTRSNTAMSPDGKKLAAIMEKSVAIIDLDTKADTTVDLQDAVDHAEFVMNGTRLFTVDGLGNGTLWDLTTKQPKKVATIVLMQDSQWLVYDEEGRYDASDPSAVTGAYFVLEWEGGLEPIAMPQLKSLFYEPKLLSKALGIDKEPPRDVPSLESLRLYPELEVKATTEGAYDIKAKERDNGGVGKISVYLNGKLVSVKQDADYYRFDPAKYSAFLLTDALLPKGQGNAMTVTVTNENGDLTSPAITTDIGVPPGLKAPDVKLYALFVGVGDYAGTNGDLTAPPGDAKALSAALDTVGAKLLPGRVNITTLTTKEQDPAHRPTRANIMGWLQKTAKESTSSDIAFVFLAGHGTSKIADKSGYFFLTSEADPGDVTASSIGTATVSGEDLRQALAAIPAGKQVVILDTCHSGAAAQNLIGGAGRSVSGEYQRAWEAIKDTTGTWLLAGAASDQLSYESTNVEHGMLTYSLLEAMDKASAEGLRQTPSGELFVDVEKWLNYAANRVDSLKTELGLGGVQKPEFKRSTHGSSFDIGALEVKQRGFIGLLPPKPIVIVGTFQKDEEDPLGLEDEVQKAMRDAKYVKAWFEVQKHPGVYRMAGTYTVDGDSVSVKLFLQIFDEGQVRKTIQTFEVKGAKTKLKELAENLRQAVEAKVQEIEDAKKKKS